jgi:hypothetical protein
MSAIIVFDEFDAWEFYQHCIEHVEDREYCKEAAKLVLEVQAGQLHTYSGKVRAVLPDYKRLAVVIDKERRFVVIYLDVAVRAESASEGKPRSHGSRVVALFYERCGSGFCLKMVDWITPEIRAMMNPHPSAFFTNMS